MARERSLPNGTPRPDARILTPAGAGGEASSSLDELFEARPEAVPDVVRHHGSPVPPPIDDDGLLAAIVGPPRLRTAVSSDPSWARTLRRFARGVAWLLPVGAVCFALTGMIEWPSAGSASTAGSDGTGPGRWLAVTVLGLALSLLGQVAVAALLAATRGRVLALAAMLCALPGSVLLATRLGLVGQPVEVDSVTHRLGLVGAGLVALGWLLLGAAAFVSRVLSRIDGLLVLAFVGLTGAAALQSWQFLLAVASMMLLAAGLGLAWGALRITPDGVLRVED